MIERRYFNRFYAVFWRAGVGKKGGGSWNYTVTDTKEGEALGGSELGLSKASFEKAHAEVMRWVIYRHNVPKRLRKRRGPNLALLL